MSKNFLKMVFREIFGPFYSFQWTQMKCERDKQCENLFRKWIKYNNNNNNNLIVIYEENEIKIRILLLILSSSSRIKSITFLWFVVGLFLQRCSSTLSEQKHALNHAQNPLPMYIVLNTRDKYSLQEFKGSITHIVDCDAIIKGVVDLPRKPNIYFILISTTVVLLLV